MAEAATSRVSRLRLTPSTAILLVGLYVLAGRLGLALAFVNASATAVWPPTGIALAAVLLFGYRVWPAIFMGAFFTNEMTAGTVLTSLLIAAGNTGEALLGACLLKRFAPGSVAFRRSHDMFLFMIAALGSAVVAATVGVTTLAANGLASWSDYSSIWLTWWLGDATGAIVVAPAILLWATAAPAGRSRERLAELLAMAALVVGVGWFVFVVSDQPLGFLCIPVCVWVAFRFGPREAAVATCVLSTLAIWGTIRGLGTFAGQSTNDALLLLQSFLAVLSAVGVTVGIAVTGRRDAEQRLRKINADTESRLAEAQEIAHVGSWEWNVADNSGWWSEELYRICGLDPASFVPSYEACMNLLPADERERLEGIVQQALAGRQPFQFEHRIVRPDGTRPVLSSFGRPVVDDSGTVIRFAGAVQDITERVAAEETVRRSERRLRTIIEAEPACVKVVSRDGILLEMNRAGLEVLAAGDPSEVIGRPALDFVHPSDRVRYQEMHDAACSGSPGRLEFRVVALTGSERWVDAHAVPFDTTVDGRMQRAVLSVTSDVTERKHLEDQLRHSQKMEAVGRLAGGIAHDFNNLLTVIHGFGSLVLTRVRHQPEIAADIEEITKAAERASQLTRQLLAFSRTQLLMPRVLNLNQVVRGLENMLRRIISEAIHLDIDTEPFLGRTRTDEGQIEQLVMNLVVNACDAMPQGGTLRIATANVALDAEFARRHPGSVPGQYVALVVRDTGVGMTPDVLARAFEPFFTTKGPGKGTGLGLSTVYGLVKQSDGYITIESTPGRGTTVTAYLPTVDEPVDSALTRPQVVPALEGTETILLVEDETGVRGLMRKILEAYGYTVLHAQDAAEALAIEESHRGTIHLLVSDIVMPRLSGPALAQRIVQRRPDISVLFVSGHAGPEALALGVKGQHVSFLQKPFTAESLVAGVRDRLDDIARPAAPPL